MVKSLGLRVISLRINYNEAKLNRVIAEICYEAYSKGYCAGRTVGRMVPEIETRMHFRAEMPKMAELLWDENFEPIKAP